MAIRYISYPTTEPPPEIAKSVVECFRHHEPNISTEILTKGLKSDRVLAAVRPNLIELGFAVEKSKKQDQKIERPVFFGENGTETLRYEVDAYHENIGCGIEIEAGRATASNAIYRDLIQALVMVNISHLILAVPIAYKYKSSSGKEIVNRDYDTTKHVAGAIYGHSRVKMPYGLTVLGY